MKIIYTIFFILFVSLISCDENSSSNDGDIVIPANCEETNYDIFDEGETLGIVEPPLYEISGIAASINYPGYFWVHNDSGNSPIVYLVDEDMKIILSIELTNTSNIDWEDIACLRSPYDGKVYIYIGDFGDNAAVRNQVRLIKIAEPEGVSIDTLTERLRLENADHESIFFEYADGPKDAESLIIDPYNLDMYVISKREFRSRVFYKKYPYEKKEDGNVVLEHIATLPFNFAVAADISQLGDEILVKSRIKVKYWKREGNENLKETFSRPPICLPYIPEPQGEAICFSLSADAFYTVSEIKGYEALEVTLNRYRRK